MSYSAKRKLEDNIAALEVLNDRLQNSYFPLSEEAQQELLSHYSGWGGLKGVLNNWDVTKEQWIEDGASKQDIELYDRYQKAFELVREIFPYSQHKEVINSIKNSTLTAFYTPSVVPATFYEVLKDYMKVTTIYEPSAGSGVFLQEAFKVFPSIDEGVAYEKDILTSKVLEAISNCKYRVNVYAKPFEESSDKENGKYDLITSNIPFGDMKVFDPKFKDNNLTGKIHNYFFAKGVDKIREGGILAFLVSDAFLNTVSNRTARKYLFDKCDFISLAVMPDNLMNDTGGTMAPSHFLVVQKNSSKTELSPEEEMLIESSFVENEGKKYAVNRYLQENSLTCLFKDCKTKIGKNQYGKPSVEVHWDKAIEEIALPFSEILRRDFALRGKFDPKPVAKIVDNCDKGIEIPVGKVKVIDRNHWGWDQEIHEKAIDIALEQSGLSGMFKPSSEWEQEEKTFSQAGLTTTEIVDNYTNPEQVVPPIQISDVLPKYVPFKNGLIIEK
jgi:hypothetical protein